MKEAGFTLLEVLVAITITGVIIGVVFSLFHQSLSIWEASQTHSSWQQQWRVLESKLTSDLQTIFVSPLGEDGLFIGEAQHLKWRQLKEDKLQQVVYSFDRQANKLVKKVVVDGQVVNQLEFFPDLKITRVKFSFNHEQVGYWKSNWNYSREEKLPTVIKVEVTADKVMLPPLVIENFIGRKYGGS